MNEKQSLEGRPINAVVHSVMDARERGGNPAPLKSLKAQPNVTLIGLHKFCLHFNCSRMQLHRWSKLVPFPKKWKMVFRYNRRVYEADTKELDLWFKDVRYKLDRVWSQHTQNIRYH